MTTLTIGNLLELTQNVVYAMPARRVLLFSNVALQVDNDDAFGSSASISANASVEVAAAFVRCTTGTALVRVTA
jgi:hypothetical protein